MIIDEFFAKFSGLLFIFVWCLTPPPANRLGRGTGNADRPTVTDQIKARKAEADLRASEAALRKELVEERKRFKDFSRDETLRTMKIAAEKN